LTPLFTIHAGEFVAGSYIERAFRRLNVWVPSKDTGVDLLVTDQKNRKTISLQVKFSRDFLATHMPALFQDPLRACGWWTLNREKLEASIADYWVFVLAGFARRSTDFVIVSPSELLKRLDAIHGTPKTIQTYLWVTENERCWETRGLNKVDKVAVAVDSFKDAQRDFTPYLNNWRALKDLNG